MYLNNSGGANKQGHAVIMLVTDDGKGVIYSFAGDANQTFKIIAGGSVEGKLSKAVDEHNNIIMVDVNAFIESGKVNIESFSGDKPYNDNYDRFISISITNQQGQLNVQ